MEIKKLLTKVNFNKYIGDREKKYIVIHYTGNQNDKAVSNAKYFYSENRNASAHYFVDENEIYQVVEDNDIAWSVGRDYSNGTAPYWNKCTNANSINIEMCNSVNDNPAVLNNTIELVVELMKKYNISFENIVRHYDVCGKKCPANLIDENLWRNFKNEVFKNKTTEDEELKEALYKLNSQGVVENVDFWMDNYNTLEGSKYVRDLIIKSANILIK